VLFRSAKSVKERLHKLMPNVQDSELFDVYSRLRDNPTIRETIGSQLSTVKADAAAKPTSPLLRYAQEAAKPTAQSGFADYLERKFLKNSPSRHQGRLTSTGVMLRTGLTEAALTPHAPLRGFISGVSTGAVEALPESVAMSGLGRGITSPIVKTKGNAIRYGAYAAQPGRGHHRLLQRGLGLLDSNADEAMALGRDLGQLSGSTNLPLMPGVDPRGLLYRQGIGGAANTALEGIKNHARQATPVRDFYVVARSRMPTFLRSRMR
jgi:hypothetical protein